MGLFERLQAAKAAREGTTPPERTIDLTDSAGSTEPAGQPKQRWGQPGRCPECGGRGFLDHIDMIDRIMYQHCVECGHKWSMSEQEIKSQA